MEEVNEPMVLNNLRLRATDDEYFTNIGPILVSVNPFKWLDHLYTPAQIALYQSARPGEPLPPHTFAIAAATYRGLREAAAQGGGTMQDRSHAIIISGESGAGKTEATKKCLQYIAEVARGSGRGSFSTAQAS